VAPRWKSLPEVRAEQVPHRADVDHQRGADQDLGQQLHHDEDQLHNQLRMIAEQFPTADIIRFWTRLGRTRESGTNIFGPDLVSAALFPARQPVTGLCRAPGWPEAPLAEASDRTNELTNRIAGQSALEDFPRRHGSDFGSVLQTGHYITEESAGLHLAQHLKRHGYRVLVHDYGASPSNRSGAP